jgi:hypothetical protein
MYPPLPIFVPLCEMTRKAHTLEEVPQSLAFCLIEAGGGVLEEIPKAQFRGRCCMETDVDCSAAAKRTVSFRERR